MSSDEKQESTDDVKLALSDLLTIGNLSIHFARVDRAPRYLDGQRETDVEHSFHLALSATELAARYYPELDIGLVSQFSLVHDLPEVYAGDVWTFNITAEDRIKKEQAEQEATHRLLRELPPHTAELLERYERQDEPEARFVRLVDKILPAIINTVALSASTFKDDVGLSSSEELDRIRTQELARLKSAYPEFDSIHHLMTVVFTEADKKIFDSAS